MRYRLLGPVTADGEAGPLRLGGPKQRAVVAALLLHANRVVSEERLFDLVWGQRPPPSVRGRLQVHVSDLRKVLGRDVITRPSSGYLLNVREGELDLHEFQQSVTLARADKADGRVESAARRLRFALSLWTGPALDGVSESLAEREARALEEQRISAIEELYDAELAAGRHAMVVGELGGLAREHPFHERLQAHLMLALHRCGRSPEALRVYLETYDVLESELGIQPGQQLQDLRLRIINGEDDEPGQASTEPVVVAPARPAELPHDIRGFAGRDAERAKLHAQLAGCGQAGGIWVISGTAGVGKTALAVRWAHEVRGRFPDGQLYLDLHGFDGDDDPLPPTAALTQLLRALGTDPHDVPADLDGQARLYRSLLADKRVLVLLDNARDAAQVLPLLPSSGAVVVTSRNRLGELVARTGAHSLPLGMLSDDGTNALLVGLLGARLVAAEPEATAELARLCGRLPLALRIAAANIDSAPQPRVADLVTELNSGDRLAALTVDGAEESVVAAALSVSYRALPSKSRRMFRLLGLMPGADHTPHTAAALADVPVAEAARTLRALAATSLIEQHAADRYRFHDLVGLYAADRAQADEDDDGREQALARLAQFSLSAADTTADATPEPTGTDASPGTRAPRAARDQRAEPPDKIRFPGSAEASLLNSATSVRSRPGRLLGTEAVPLGDTDERSGSCRLAAARRGGGEPEPLDAHPRHVRK